MKRPEKIHDLYADKNDCAIWNNCCDKWNKFLPSEDEIYKIIKKSPLAEYRGIDGIELEVIALAKAIAKRLGVK